MPLFQKESSGKAFDMKMSLNCIKRETVGKTYFDMNGCARTFVLTPGQKATLKWPVCCLIIEGNQCARRQTWRRGVCLDQVSGLFISPLRLLLLIIADFLKVHFWCFVSRLDFSKSLVYRGFRSEVENDLWQF